MVNIYKEAIKAKIRFNSPKGLVTTEDLYHLATNRETALSMLDIMAKEVNAKIKADAEDSFRSAAKKADPIDELKLEILIDVIRTIETDIAERAKAIKVAQEIEKINALIEKRSEKDMSKLSMKELKALKAKQEKKLK